MHKEELLCQTRVPSAGDSAVTRPEQQEIPRHDDLSKAEPIAHQKTEQVEQIFLPKEPFHTADYFVRTKISAAA
jgi:hypothetical protein